MTNDQIKIALGEALIPGSGRRVRITLDEMYEAEKLIFNPKDWTKYTNILVDEVQSKSDSPIHATARQKAEAFLKTIGKWAE